MKPRKGWLLTRQIYAPGGGASSKALAVIIPSKRVTNKAVDDLVANLHKQNFGNLWEKPATWHDITTPNSRPKLELRVSSVVGYRLTEIDVYG